MLDLSRIWFSAYYDQERSLLGAQTRTEEADKVSHRIVEILEDGSFGLDPHMLNMIPQTQDRLTRLTVSRRTIRVQGL